MKYDVYKFFYQSSDALEFGFKSIGPNGEIDIVVQFSEISEENITELSFGNKMPDGNIDDQVKNSNNDRNKILATIAAAVAEYTAFKPEKFVVFSGSTEARTRLYRMAITMNYDELITNYEIYGLKLVGLRLCMEDFIKGKTYVGFGVKRKKYKLHS